MVLADAGILCNIDLDAVLDDHIASGKDITVVTKSGVANGKKIIDLGVKLDKNGGIADMVSGAAATEDYLSTLYLYVVSKDLLVRHVRDAIAHNLFLFRAGLVLRLYQQGKAQRERVPLLRVWPCSPPLCRSISRVTWPFWTRRSATTCLPASTPFTPRSGDRVPSYYGEGLPGWRTAPWPTAASWKAA